VPSIESVVPAQGLGREPSESGTPGATSRAWAGGLAGTAGVMTTPSNPDSQGSDLTQNAEKDPADWVTGDEPLTGPQRSYLETLAREAGEDLPDNLTKAEASALIERLQEKTGRGR
jgi:Protein of unknown function (DUF3072)